MRLFDFDGFLEIFDTISRNKLRTLITTFGVVWGMMMLVLLLGAGKGLENGMQERFSGFTVRSMYVWSQRTTLPYNGLKPGRYYRFDNADVTALENEVEEINIVAPRAQLGGWQDGKNVSRKNKFGNFSVMGDHPLYEKLQPMNIYTGRFVNEDDLSDKRKVCVIGEQVRKELFADNEEPVGDYIKIQGVYFRVIGVFKSKKNQGQEADRDNRTIYIPLSTFQQAFNYGDKINWFALGIADGYTGDEAEEAVKETLFARHNVNPNDTRAIGSFNAEKEAYKYLGLFKIIRIFIWFVGIGTLLAGAIGITNIMLISVSDRTREIGVRKALGAKPFSIVLMIVQEAILITSFAGVLGLTIGVLGLELMNKGLAESGAESQFFTNPEVDFRVAVISVVIIIFVGVLSGLLPAIRAVSINPIQALKTE